MGSIRLLLSPFEMAAVFVRSFVDLALSVWPLVALAVLIIVLKLWWRARTSGPSQATLHAVGARGRRR